MMRRLLVIGLILTFSGMVWDTGYHSVIADNPVSVSVYPNPVVDGNLFIKADLKIEKIEIMSIVGQIVFSQKLDPLYSVRLNLDLQTGIYLVKIFFIDKTSITKRIWVN
jgi:hypothetical protein